MRVKDIMTPDPICCTDVAKIFVDQDCGAVPVLESFKSGRPVGIVTDRDIACRAVAAGRDALNLTAGDCMSVPCVGVSPEMSLGDCYPLFGSNRVRRLVVVDAKGCCCGIVSQADIIRRGKQRKAADAIREISQPSPSASAVAV